MHIAYVICLYKRRQAFPHNGVQFYFAVEDTYRFKILGQFYG